MKLTRLQVFLLIAFFLLGAWLLLLGVDRSYRPKPNYALVEKNLYVGGHVAAPPPGTKAVLNLCEQKDPYQAEVHEWDPIRDAGPTPDLAWLREKVDFIATHKDAGNTVYVHCRNGASRSVMVVTAYLMRREGWTRDRALSYVRSKRPEARPNPAFLDLLLEWEKELRNAG